MLKNGKQNPGCKSVHSMFTHKNLPKKRHFVLHVLKEKNMSHEKLFSGIENCRFYIGYTKQHFLVKLSERT
jgi:hypothetical protein